MHPSPSPVRHAAPSRTCHRWASLAPQGLGRHEPRHRHLAPRPGTDHAVRRYCERYFGAVLDDQKALPVLRKAGHVLAQVRARLADFGGVLMVGGHRTGKVVAFPEAMKVRAADGVVVTVLARVAQPPAGPVSQVPARPGPPSNSG